MIRRHKALLFISRRLTGRVVALKCEPLWCWLPLNQRWQFTQAAVQDASDAPRVVQVQDAPSPDYSEDHWSAFERGKKLAAQLREQYESSGEISPEQMMLLGRDPKKPKSHPKLSEQGAIEGLREAGWAEERIARFMKRHCSTVAQILAEKSSLGRSGLEEFERGRKTGSQLQLHQNDLDRLPDFAPLLGLRLQDRKLKGSPYEHGITVGLYEAGISRTVIAKIVKRDQVTVSKTLSRYKDICRRRSQRIAAQKRSIGAVVSDLLRQNAEISGEEIYRAFGHASRHTGKRVWFERLGIETRMRWHKENTGPVEASLLLQKTSPVRPMLMLKNAALIPKKSRRWEKHSQEDERILLDIAQEFPTHSVPLLLEKIEDQLSYRPAQLLWAQIVLRTHGLARRPKITKPAQRPPGRKSYTEDEAQLVLDLTRQQPELTAPQIVRKLNLNISHQACSRLLRRNGLRFKHLAKLVRKDLSTPDMVDTQ